MTSGAVRVDRGTLGGSRSREPWDGILPPMTGMSHADSPAPVSLAARLRGFLTRPVGSRANGHAGWMRALGHGLVLAGLLFLAYVFLD